MTDPIASAWTSIAATQEWERAELRQIEDRVIGLFDQFRFPLLRYLSGFGLPVHEAEEIAQDIFLALFRHLKSGKPDDNLRGWIFRVGHNLAIKRREGDVRHPVDRAIAASEKFVMDQSPSPETLAVENQTHRHLRLAMAALPERDSQCLRLRAEGLTFREIARVLSISVGAVSISLTRSVARLTRVANR